MNTNDTLRVDISLSRQHKEKITACGAGISAVSAPTINIGVSPPLAVTQVRDFGIKIAHKSTNYATLCGRSAAQITELATRKLMDDLSVSLGFGIFSTS